MVFPLIWSGGTREGEIGPDAMRDCPKCGSSQEFVIFAIWDEIGVWPLKNARWDVRCVTRCKRCGTQFKSSHVPTEEEKARARERSGPAEQVRRGDRP